MSRIIIVHYTKYSEDKGGVPLYNLYLQRVFSSAMLYSYEDYPGHGQFVAAGEHVKAAKLNLWLQESGKINEGDIVIGDGIWGSWMLNPKKYRLISVSHGVWALNADSNNPLIDVQKRGYANSRVTVACSAQCKLECDRHYGLKATTILTGLDLDFWKPVTVESHTTPIVLWVKKWKDISEVQEGARASLGSYKHRIVETLVQEELRKLYSQADVFVHITKNEGNAFAILKALACDTPVVSSRTGLFAPEAPPGCGFAVNNDVKSVVAAVKALVKKNVFMAPRRWMEHNASLELFTKQWKELIKHV